MKYRASSHPSLWISAGSMQPALGIRFYVSLSEVSVKKEQHPDFLLTKVLLLNLFLIF